MTNAELRSLLAQYPDDMSVLVVCDRRCRQIIKVDHIVEMEVNEVSIEIVAEDKSDLSAPAGKISEEIWLKRGRK